MVKIALKAQAYICEIVLLLLLTISAKSQGLQIGDRISDFELKKIINYKSSSARLTDFTNGKALLIDFWFSSCSSCIESFTKLDSLQNEFQDNLNILLVTYEPKEKVFKTFNTIKRISHVKLPTVVSDTLLHLAFPHLSAPHQIWIDKDGKIMAITDHSQLIRKNIRALITNEELNLPLKKDDFKFSFELPLASIFANNNTIKYSFFSNYQPGIPSSSGFYIDPESGLLIARSTNVDFQKLYVQAYNQWGNDFNYNRIILEDSVLDRLKPNGQSINSFCFEIWWKDTSKVNACSEMQSELDRFFKIKSFSEKRKMQCIILKEIGVKKRYQSQLSSGITDAYSKNDTLFLDNVKLRYPIKNILNYGRYAWSPFQFIDETNYKDRVSIQLPKRFESIAQVNQFLKDFDLEVKIEDRLIDVIVIKDAVETQ